MGRKTRIAAWAMREEVLRGKTQEEMLAVALEKIDAIAGYKPDLICFPEIFLKTGGDAANPRWREIGAEMLRAFGQKAREISSYILTSYYEPSEKYPDFKYNCAVLLDRQGREAGRYRKVHTVYEESTVNHVLPGSEYPVFETDFGKIGVQTCFDIGWREGWNELAKKGARLVVWNAAYDGGNLLDTYAAYNQYFVVSTVRTSHARIIDPDARTLAESGRWDGLDMADIDLTGEVFHMDRHFEQLDEIRRKLGAGVTIHPYSEEGCFWMESNDPDWPMERIKREFDLLNYREYHMEADALQKQWREKYR